MLEDINVLLKNNSYPGRGIVIGLTEDGENAAIAYFIMGRSENSRNRVFVKEGSGIKTQAFDLKKLTDPSLVIYAPVRTVDENITIVTNGDQTDTVYDFIKIGKSFEDALMTREFEPDAPNFTPRISGLVDLSNGFTYKLSILKSADGNENSCQRMFFNYVPLNGLGHFIHTYKCDGKTRIPSFEGEPKAIKINDFDKFTDDIWESLNFDNKVSLFTRFINLKTKESITRIINKNEMNF